METAFFIYTSAIIFVAVVACSVALVVWLMTQRRDCLVASAGFALYVLNLSLIFFDEYARNKYDYAVTFELPLQHPLATTLLGIGIMACIWTWALMRTRTKVSAKSELAFLLPFAAVSFLLVPRSSAASTVQQYLYWLWRDLGVVASLAYIAWCYRHRATDVEKLDLDRGRRFFVIAAVLIFLTIAEDTFMIMIYRPSPALVETTFFWFLSERNISENFLMVACMVQLLQRLKSLLAVYARHPRTEDVDEGPVAVSEDDLESRIVLFSDAHELSRREQDVLGLVLRGVDTQNIASRLYISPGTVKSHLHRIYRKVDVPGREQLVEEFWRS